MRKRLVLSIMATAMLLSACASSTTPSVSVSSTLSAGKGSSTLSTAETSSAVSSAQTDYSSFTGTWTINGVSDIAADGGIGLTIKVDTQGNAAGTMVISTRNAGRVDEADFSGIIQDGQLSSPYDDTFGDSGVFHFEFQEGKITEYAEITNDAGAMSFNESPQTLLKISDTVS